METVIVLGLGAMGSAAAAELARRGHRVLGFDRFTPPHRLGSSHGQTRIIRQSYWEDTRYVPLLKRAYDLWRRLEKDSGKELLRLTGGLMIGPLTGPLVDGSRQSAEMFDLPHEMLETAELRRRYPMFAVEQGTVALWEANAGYLRPEDCVRQQLVQATSGGATLHFNQEVLRWEPTREGGVIVETADARYEGDRLVITAGPWAPEVLKALGLPLYVTRQVLYWTLPSDRPEMFREDRLPIFLVEGQPGEPVLYGFPALDESAGPAGVKVALHGSREVCTPETVRREVSEEDRATIRSRLSVTMPLLRGQIAHAETCLYTMTPDENFVIDYHPEFPQITVAAGFSGHGFKFASVVGEILADLATDRMVPYDLGFFSSARFALAEVLRGVDPR